MAPTLLDGAMGTELSRRGYTLRAPLWGAGAVLDAPELVRSIHGDYARAGAEVVVTNTFGLGASDGRWVAEAVALARAAAPRARIAGSIGPADPARPEADRIAHYIAVGDALRDAGVDVLFAETHTRIDGARLALQSLKPLGLPVWVALSCDPGGHPLGGDRLPPTPALDADALFVGCSESAALDPALRHLAPSSVPLGLRPSRGRTLPSGFDPLGVPEDELCATVVQASRDHDLAYVGGCCGTTPAFIADLRRALSR